MDDQIKNLVNLQSRCDEKPHPDRVKPGTKVHRHNTPHYLRSVPKTPLIRKLVSAVQRINWNYVRALRELRTAQNRRLSIRSERREALTFTAQALLAHAFYNPVGPDCAFCEVRCSVEDMARITNQLHKYANGRKSYDPFLHAIHDLEKAKLIVVHRGYDPETKQYKAMRIWLMDSFFYALGFTPEAMEGEFKSIERYTAKHGLARSIIRTTKAYLERIKRSNVADLSGHPKLMTMLRQNRMRLLGELDKETSDELKGLEGELREIRPPRKQNANDLRARWLAWYNAAGMERFAVMALFKEHTGHGQPSTDEHYTMCLDLIGKT